MKTKFYKRLTMVFATILMFTFFASSQTTINVLIAVDEDDAEETLHRSKKGDIDLTSSDLELGHDGGYAQAVGIRYYLPVGHTDTITEAYIQFACDKAHDPSLASVDTLTLKIYAEAADDAAAFTTDSANITMRAKTTAQVLWTPPEWNTNNEVSDTQRTVDISALVQEVIDRDGWVAGNAIVFVLTPTNPPVLPASTVADTMGYREAGAFSDGDGPPKLQITFKSGPATIAVHVAEDADDAEEALHRSKKGEVDLESSDLELGHDGGYAQAVGVRYMLPVMKGAIISDAYIQFACDKAHDPSKASVDTLTLKIYAEAADDAAAFTTDSANITMREQTTASVLWTPSEWNTDNEVSDTQKTVDISALIQEVVDRDGWAEGNAIVLVLTPTNPPVLPESTVADTMGYREAGAFSDGDGPPVLHLTYVAVPVATSAIIAVDEDDAEETLHRSKKGDVDLESSDLELGHDGGYAQAVGIRYVLPAGRGATISEAYIQFACDKAHDPSKASVDTLTLKIYAEAADDAAPFTTDSANITMRAKTTAQILWTPPEWNTDNEVSDTQKTVDISALIQEVVSRDGWNKGNAIVLVLTPTNPPVIPESTVADTMGYREAGAFSDGDGPPVLHLTYSGGLARVLHTDATLADLTLDVGTLVPAFDPDSTNYTVELPPGTTSVTVETEVNDYYAMVTEADTVVDVSSLSGEATIVVTAEDGTKMTYTVTMTVSTVGVEKVVNPLSDIRLYHNSLINQLTIFSTSDVEMLEIYSITGKLLNRMKINNQESIDISTANLTHGVYLVRMKLSSNTIQTGKFVK